MKSTNNPPSFKQVNDLRLEIYSKVKVYPSDYGWQGKAEAKLRKRSELFAKALRAKGWLALEGYAKSSRLV